MLLKNFFDLNEVSFDDVSHSSEVLKDFFGKSSAKYFLDFWFHQAYHLINVHFVFWIMKNELVLKFHNSFNCHLELFDFLLFFFW